MEKEEILKKILAFVKVLVVLAVVNTILLFIALGGQSETKAETSSNEEYDVSMFEQISSSDFIQLFNDKNSGTNIIYLGREGCSYCLAFLPSLQQAQRELGYKTKYLDIASVSDSEAEKIMALNDFLGENYGYTPIVIITKNGKYVDGSVGYVEYDDFISFLNKNGIK